jgi:16S rRNA processing protein RimM
MMTSAPRVVVIGQVAGVFGVRGWVKLISHTEPREDILRYRQCLIGRGGEWRPQELLAGRPQGKGIVAHLKGCDTPEAARLLMGCDIGVPRSALPALSTDEYYWADLRGLRVVTREGVELGVIDGLLETGANDVLVVKGEREHLIPYVQGKIVTAVDLEQGVMRVDWDPDF